MGTPGGGVPRNKFFDGMPCMPEVETVIQGSFNVLHRLSTVASDKMRIPERDALQAKVTADSKSCSASTEQGENGFSSSVDSESWVPEDEGSLLAPCSASRGFFWSDPRSLVG